MCGRFTLHLPPELIAEIFGAPLPGAFSPKYNVAPGQVHPVVIRSAEGRRIVPMKWGLIPHWAQDPRLGFSMMNARSESLASKPAFKGAFRARRCLIPADGFFEWRHDGKRKEPFYVTPNEGGVIPFAGLWDRWLNPQGESVETFTIITCASNELVRPLHFRMPVIIGKRDFDVWLDPAAPPVKLQELLRPFPAGKMTLWRVGPLVNNPRNETEECIRKV